MSSTIFTEISVIPCRMGMATLSWRVLDAMAKNIMGTLIFIDKVVKMLARKCRKCKICLSGVTYVWSLWHRPTLIPQPHLCAEVNLLQVFYVSKKVKLLYSPKSPLVRFKITFPIPLNHVPSPLILTTYLKHRQKVMRITSQLQRTNVYFKRTSWIHTVRIFASITNQGCRWVDPDLNVGYWLSYIYSRRRNLINHRLSSFLQPSSQCSAIS